MATLDEVGTCALALPGVVEGVRYGHRTWGVGGRVFAWERPFSKADVKRFAGRPVPAGPILGLSVADLSEKEALIAAHEPYFTIPHFNGYPAVLLRLDEVDEPLLAEALLDAWLAVAPPELARSYLDQA